MPKLKIVSDSKASIAREVNNVKGWEKAAKSIGRKRSPADVALDAAQQQAAAEAAAYRARCGQAMLALQEARNPSPVASCGSALHLYPREVVTPDGTFPLTPAIQATVEASGNFHTSERSTATRMIGGKLLLGDAGMVAGAAARKTTVQDMREVYLMIDGGTWYATYSVQPHMGGLARQFVMALNVTARNVESTPRQEEAYGYADEDPLDGDDPLGLCAWTSTSSASRMVRASSARRQSPVV